MRIFMAIFVALLAAGGVGCGATRRDAGTSSVTSPGLTGATVTFNSRDSGKDADSSVTVQLLRNNAELGAEARLVGTKFDDHATSGPLALSVSAPFRRTDVDDARLRLRMTPDGKDDWTFDLQLSLNFADGSMQRFAWNGLRLDNASPERTLPLAPARLP